MIFRALVLSLSSVCAALTLAAPGVAQEDDRRLRINLGLDYSSGSYGEPEKTEILYVPLSLRVEDGPWTLRAVLPWLHVSGPSLILDGGDSSGGVGTRTNASDSGLGDMSLSAMYSFEQFYAQDLFLDVTARVKIPTASLEAGLGTGEPDAALQFDVAKAFGPFIPFATIGYRWVGVPDGFKLRNTAYGSVGLQYSWSDRVATGLSYDYRQSSVRRNEAPQDATAYLNIRFAGDWSVNIYAVKGFSDNSPDAGGGVAFVYRFPWQERARQER